MPRRVVGVFLVVATVLLLSACQIARPAASRPDPRAAIEGALTWLKAQPAVDYRLPSGATFTASRGGLARGTLTLADQQVPAVRVGGNLYLRAPATYWTAQGMSHDRADQYGNRWARSVLSLDPGMALAPDVFAGLLGAAIAPGVQAKPLTLGDGTELYDVAGLQVTAASPYRVTSFKPALLGPGGPPVLGNAGVEVHSLGGHGQDDLRTGLTDDVDALGQPFVAGPAVATNVTSHALTCTDAGRCTDDVRVGNTLIGDAPQALALVVLRSAVTSSALGTRDCGQELVTPLNASVTLSCGVNFDVPRTDGAARVSAVPTVSAEPVAVVDLPSIRHEIASVLGA